MTYSIIFDSPAIDFMATLPYNIRERVFNKITSTNINPFHYFHRLAGNTFFKLRVGDFRVLADIDQERKIIQIRFVGHRKNVYK